MTLLCPSCSKVNPAGATYCYYDGQALTAVSEARPWWLGTMPFPTPFSFPDGHSCGDFDQLALSCDRRWNEARQFLADGIWCSFFRRIGRHDLAIAAAQAAREPDSDLGLASLLERLPTDALRRPALSLLSETLDLGTLAPGKDQQFEVLISNRGGLVLAGAAMTDCEWLFFGDRQGDVSRKLFQTRDHYTLVVRVLGSKLRAGPRPLEGAIVIDTNGGTAALAVKASVPILPFPQGQYPSNVLAGARSPRELAQKARAHPVEAAALFEQGAVKAWYASNGWTYPIQGTQGKGKAAVQQFFEALGLSKPPRLEISTERIVCQGEVGQRLTETVTVSTKEARFVSAEAHSDQAWLTVGPSSSHGNRVTIPLLLEVPPRPGESLHARVTVQGNGQQRFVVPVTLAVEGSAAGEEEAEKEDSPQPPWRPHGVLAGAGVALLVFLVLGSVALFLKRPGPAPPVGPPVVGSPQPAPLGKDQAWWEGIPDQHLAADAQELKANAPADSQSIFERLAAKSDTDRFKVYEELAARLPGLVRDGKVRGPLARFLTECCVHEPSDLNIAQVRRGLAGLFPREGAPFRPEDRGAELEDALYARQVLVQAMSHKAVKPDRARSLADEFRTVFGVAIDTSAPPDVLAVEVEKQLAVRCYRNTLPTAAKSIEHALTMRAVLLERFPHLPQALRDQVDADLLVIGLGKGDEALWPKLEPIVKTSLARDGGDIGLKLVDVYAKAEPGMAGKMEEVLAARWKGAANPTWTQADRAAAFRKKIVNVKLRHDRAAERLSQLRKLIDGLVPVKAGEKSELVQLQQAVRLAHSSTLGSILFNEDAEIERFDELVNRAPDARPPATAEEKKGPEDKLKPPAPGGPKVIDVTGRAYAIQGQLTKESERDPRRGTFHKTYPVVMRAGEVYTIDLLSTEFRPSLRLESAAGRPLAVPADRGVNPNAARISYAATANGTYQVVATTALKGATGAYTLQIQRAGMPLPGMPAPWVRRGVPPRFAPMPFFPVLPEQPAAVPKAGEKESQVSKSDLAALTEPARPTRVTAFTNLAGKLPKDLEAQHAEKIASYLLVTVASDAEMDEVSGKLESLGDCRNLLLALADLISSNDKVSHERTAAVVGGILGQRLRFARDEDWRSASRKLLLQRALDLTRISATAATADLAAHFLRDLYKEQGLAFGLEDEGFMAQTEPSRVLEGLIKHVAAEVTTTGLPPAEKEYLEQIDRHLKAAQFVADNDLENLVLLQRIWLRVLTGYLQERVPAQARGLRQIQQDLLAYDRDARNVFEQLRVGEEKILRAWGLAYNLTGR